MIDQDKFILLVIAVITMVILTALSRVLPFLLSDKLPIMRFFMRPDSPITPLGGAIIGAMTVVLTLPFIQHATSERIFPTVCCAVLTVITTIKGINTGFAVLIGMIGYLLAKLIVG